MIYDCFLFNDELELLEIRLHELDGVVDRVLLIESSQTMTGNPKPLHYEANKHLFEAFHHKIIHRVYDYHIPATNAASIWEREIWSRNHLKTLLGPVKDDDVVIISDADEIPRREAVMSFRPSMSAATLVQQLAYYRLNCYYMSAAYWTLSKVVNGQVWSKTLPQNIRLAECPEIAIHGGWHFSYLVPVERIRLKIQSWAHQEYNTPEITDLDYLRQCVETPKDLFGRDAILAYCPIDRSLPRYVLTHLGKYRALDLVKDVFPPTQENENEE